MARSLGLTAYRALARRGDAPTPLQTAPRPNGELAWIHAAESGSLIAIQDLAGRLCANRPGLSVLITHTENSIPAKLVPHPERILLYQGVPADHPDSVAAFLDHWQPDICLWAWGTLRPNLVLETANRKCPMILFDVDTRGFDRRRDRWMPELTRRLLRHFSHAFTRSGAGHKRLVQIGMPRDRITVTSVLMAGGQALPCSDSDLANLSEALVGRPVWFATNVPPAEVPIVLSAHRQALRLSHRLVLILNPSKSEDAPTCATLAAQRGFDMSHWDDGAEPDDATQIILTCDPQDRGLFFRVAPVSFLGSTLLPDKGGIDPLEAAALGSAVLYGPKVRHFLPSYTRLAAAGAARIVNDAAALGFAVSRLIAPDQAAAMAHAGWDVISQGAALTDRLTELVQDILDEQAGAR